MSAPRPLHGDRMVPEGCEDAAVNVLPGGPPAWLTQALRDVDVTRYPDERPATVALAARHGRPADHALALNGAAEAFWLLAGALRPARPVVVSPSFTEPATALRAQGRPPESVVRDPARGFALTPGLVPEAADLVHVGNPCNPTGRLHPAEDLLALARPGRTLVVDESFMDLVPGEPASVAAAAGEVPGLVVLRSLTKSLAIPGLRAGYALGPPDLLERMAALRQAWPVNAPALAALQAYATRPDATTQRAAQVAADRERLTAALRALPQVHVHPGAANFLLLRVPDGARVRERLLAEHRIAVRPTGDLGLDADHLRVAVRGGDADARLAAALAQSLG